MNYPVTITYLQFIIIEIATKLMNRTRSSEENMLSQIRRVSKRAKSWAKSKVIHLKQ